ncbi:MAG: hypothetical protein AAB929_00730 [Patescibacteria group bacterium]
MKKPNCTYTDFQKLDLRVGQIITVTPIEGSNKLLALSVDFGLDYGVVEILSGISQLYKPEQLTGNKYLFLANLEPKKMMGRMSNGMVFATETPPKYALIKVSKQLKNGIALC